MGGRADWEDRYSMIVIAIRCGCGMQCILFLLTSFSISSLLLLLLYTTSSHITICQFCISVTHHSTPLHILHKFRGSEYSTLTFNIFASFISAALRVSLWILAASQKASPYSWPSTKLWRQCRREPHPACYTGMCVSVSLSLISIYLSMYIIIYIWIDRYEDRTPLSFAFLYTHLRTLTSFYI